MTTSGNGGARAREIVRKARADHEKDERQRTRSPSAEQAAQHRVELLSGRSGLRRFLFENGLTIAMTVVFVVSFIGQVLAGQRSYNEEQREHGQPTRTIREYVRSGHFLEATAENWESEFLQMGLFVLLTAYLYQRGSSESKTIEEPDPVDQDATEARNDPEAPWPVRRGGLWLAVYKRSLGGVLLLFFAISFAAHAVGGAMAHNESQRQHGGEIISVTGYLATSQFWFESFQNWQSEFFSVAVLVLLSIWLRQQGSAQSKPVAAPSRDTSE
jgi:hypothetical protein